MKKKIISAVMVSMLALMPMMTNVNAEQDTLYATKIAPKTVAASLEGLKVTRSSAPVNDAVATGDIIEKDGKEYIAVVCGDVNGDADINSTDFMKIRYAYLELRSLDEVSQMAADVNFDEKINSTDFLRIRRHFLGVFNLCNDGEIDFGKGTSASIGNRPTLYFSKQQNDYYSEETLSLFGDIEFINTRSFYEEAETDENAVATKIFNFEGESYELTYRDNDKWTTIDEEVQYYRTDNYSLNVLYNAKTGVPVRIVSRSFKDIDIYNTTEEELKSTALRLISEYTDYEIAETDVYQCKTCICTYTLNEGGNYTSGTLHYENGFYEVREKYDGAEVYDELSDYRIYFTSYVNGLETERYAEVEFLKDQVSLTVYDVDYSDLAEMDSESVMEDLEYYLSEVAQDIFVDGKYMADTPLIYRRNDRIYAEIYCRGELQTSTEEWQVKGTYFVLDYGEG